MAALERRENVRWIDGQPFRDTPPVRSDPRPETPSARIPEWVKRAREGRLPVKSFLS